MKSEHSLHIIESSSEEHTDFVTSLKRFQQAQLFSTLILNLTTVSTLEAVGQVLENFCSEFWTLDAFVFSVKRGRGSHFKSIVLVDTVDDKKVHFQDPAVGGHDLSWAAMLGQPTLINRDSNVAAKPMSSFGSQRLSASLIFAPIRVGDTVKGILSIQSYTPGKFTEADKLLLAEIAAATGPIISRCRAEERVQEFLTLGESLNYVVDTAGVAQVVANTAANLIGWDFLSLHLYDSAEECLCLVLGLQRTDGGEIISLEKTNHPLPAPGTMLAEVLEGKAVTFVSSDLNHSELEQRSSLNNWLIKIVV